MISGMGKLKNNILNNLFVRYIPTVGGQLWLLNGPLVQFEMLEENVAKLDGISKQRPTGVGSSRSLSTLSSNMFS